MIAVKVIIYKKFAKITESINLKRSLLCQELKELVMLVV